MSQDKGGFSSVAFALVFAVCFGSVGAFASWVMGSTVYEGWAAREWVRVKADIVTYGGGNIAYKYRVGERDYTGDKLGPGPLSGGEVDEALDARLSTAQSEQKPITVFVDPENPQRSMVDPEIPWQLVLFMTPFAFAFGGVGLGALVVAVKLLLPGASEAEAKAKPQVAGSGAGFLWIFAFFWNSLAFPIALIAIPEMIQSGEWLGLLILIFPLVGVLILWGAIATTWSGIKLGRAEFHLQDAEPRLGSVVTGYLAGKRVMPGDTFRVRLSCVTGIESGSPLEHWHQDKTLRTSQTPGGARLSFSFDTPERLPPAAGERDENTKWRAEFFPQGESKAAYTFYFDMLPPAGAAMVEEDDEEEPATGFEDDEQPVPAGIPKGLEGIAAFVGKERIQERLDAMSTSERAQLHARFDSLTTTQKQALEKFGKYAHYGPLIKKLVIAAIVLFFLVQMAGVASLFLFSD